MSLSGSGALAMVNGSPLAPVDILGALVERPRHAGPSGVLEQVRDVESVPSKAALIAGAGGQFDPESDAAVLAGFSPLVVAGALGEAGKADLLDGIARLMRQSVASQGDDAARRRVLVLGVGELLRIAVRGGAEGRLLSVLRAALMAAASRGSIAGLGQRIPGAG